MHLLFFTYFLPPADKKITKSTNVAVEVTPPMNGAAGGDEVWKHHSFSKAKCLTNKQSGNLI